MRSPSTWLRWFRLDPLGLVVGTAFAAMATTPSLLPRSWLFQGIVSGVSAALGYGLGRGAHWALGWSPRWRSLRARVVQRSPDRVERGAWPVLLLVVAGTLVAVLVASAGWQRESAQMLLAEPPSTAGWLRAGPLLVVVAGGLIAGVRGFRLACRGVAHVLRRWVRLPRRLSSALSLVLVSALVVVVVGDVLLDRALTVADSSFRALDLEDPDDVRRPVSPLRSGSPSSLVAWDTLGLQGRKFVSGGPTPDELEAAAPGRSRPPVRVYVGLASAADSPARAELAVAELRRTGGLDRAVVVVVTTTGRGWVNAIAAEAVELMYGGDTAVVATQYSYLPSWLSFLLDRERSKESGRAVIDAVHAAVDALPEDDRPRLLVYGESLGSQGSEAAFTSLADIRSQADGVLWVGPPSSNELWRSLVDRRDPGTTEVAPVYASGLVVRFADSVTDLRRPGTPWLEPRILYLQNASDPIVWWTPELLLDRPDWLDETRGVDVHPAMRWYPLVTFWQVSADLMHAKEVPDGHGHNYGDLILDGWVAVAAPEGWTASDTGRVRRVLDA